MPGGAASGPVSLMTPLADGVLVLRSLTGSEALGHPFEYELDLLCTDPTLDISEILGQTITVGIELVSGQTRFFSGFVTQLELTGESELEANYRARVNPWLSLLGYTTNCRIFQNMTRPRGGDVGVS